jgi:hypothetical protein
MARAKSHKAKQTSKKQTAREKTYLTDREIMKYQQRLDLIHDVISTVVAALEAENTAHEPDFARMLRAYGMNQIYKVIEDLNEITHLYNIDKDKP